MWCLRHGHPGRDHRDRTVEAAEAQGLQDGVTGAVHDDLRARGELLLGEGQAAGAAMSIDVSSAASSTSRRTGCRAAWSISERSRGTSCSERSPAR
ncbi:hypothetical protein ACFQ3Z_03550 [Streptomyces nogalater]